MYTPSQLVLDMQIVMPRGELQVHVAKDNGILRDGTLPLDPPLQIITLGFATCVPSKCNDLSYIAIDLWQEIPYKVHIQMKNQFAVSKCVAENCVLSQQYQT